MRITEEKLNILKSMAQNKNMKVSQYLWHLVQNDKEKTK